MMKFACFERTVEALYKFVVPKPRAECSKPEQLVVTFCAGYIGVFIFLLFWFCVNPLRLQLVSSAPLSLIPLTPLCLS
jgi:hypothetical protein